MQLKKIVQKGIVFGLFTLVCSLVISLFAGEFIVKHIMPQNTYGLARLVGLHIFEKSDILPFTLQKNVNKFHHIGYTHEFDHFVSTNSLGIRGNEVIRDKPKGTYRILFLGDSMVFGWGVQDDQSYPALIEKFFSDTLKYKGKYTKIEVINAGFTDGITLDNYYSFVNKFGELLSPDLIVLDLFPYNDLSDLLEMQWLQTNTEGYPVKIESRTQTVKEGYLVGRTKTDWKFQIPFLRNTHLGILLMNAMEKGSPEFVSQIKKMSGIQEIKEEFSVNDRLACIYSLDTKVCPTSLLDNFKKAEFLIQGLKKQAGALHSDFLITIMASPDQAVPLSKKEERNRVLTAQQPQKYFKEFFDKNNLKYVDLLPTLSSSNAQRFFFTQDGHLTPAGHEEVAKTLFGYLLEKKVL